MRPQSVGLMLLFIYFPILIKVGDWVYALLQIVPIYLLITGEVILNDYFDIEKDKINKGHRPLAAGKVSKHIAKRLIIILLTAAVISAFIIYEQSASRIVLFVVVFAMLTIYSVWMNYIAAIKTFITALVTVLCLGFIFSYIGLSQKILYLMIVAFFYISSRELLMDIRDYEGDKKYGCKTLAIRFGGKATYFLALLFMLIAQVLYYNFFVIGSEGIGNVLWVVSLVILIIAFPVFYVVNSKIQNIIALILWIPMMCVIPSVIL